MIRFAELLARPGLGRARRQRGVVARARAAGARPGGHLARPPRHPHRLPRLRSRRVFDRVMTEATVARIEGFERARGALVNALTRVAHGTDRAITDLEVGLGGGTKVDLGASLEGVRGVARSQAGQALLAVGGLDESMRDLVDVIGAALFERDRLKILLGDAEARSTRCPDEAALAQRSWRPSRRPCSTP